MKSSYLKIMWLLKSVQSQSCLSFLEVIQVTICSKNLLMKFILFPIRHTLCQTLFFLSVCSPLWKEWFSKYFWIQLMGCACMHGYSTLCSHIANLEEHSWIVRVTPGNYSRHKFNRSNITLLRVALRKPEILIELF